MIGFKERGAAAPHGPLKNFGGLYPKYPILDFFLTFTLCWKYLQELILKFLGWNLDGNCVFSMFKVGPPDIFDRFGLSLEDHSISNRLKKTKIYTTIFDFDEIWQSYILRQEIKKFQT